MKSVDFSIDEAMKALTPRDNEGAEVQRDRAS